MLFTAPMAPAPEPIKNGTVSFKMPRSLSCVGAAIAASIRLKGIIFASPHCAFVKARSSSELFVVLVCGVTDSTLASRIAPLFRTQSVPVQSTVTRAKTVDPTLSNRAFRSAISSACTGLIPGFAIVSAEATASQNAKTAISPRNPNLMLALGGQHYYSHKLFLRRDRNLQRPCLP